MFVGEVDQARLDFRVVQETPLLRPGLRHPIAGGGGQIVELAQAVFREKRPDGFTAQAAKMMGFTDDRTATASLPAMQAMLLLRRCFERRSCSWIAADETVRRCRAQRLHRGKL